ncbi:MAG: response regulator, partial [Chloroflexi bacterium]|nr:response regulator [Chloroflexota bacterium]
DSWSWIETIHPDDKEQVLDTYENHWQEELHYEFRIVRPDGSIRWISNHRTPVRNEAGEIYRLVGIAEDITERKLLEEQLIQSQKLESVGRLAGGVAHDFNNLLTPIIGYSQMAMKSLPPDDKVRTQLQHIYQAAERASNLIHQLLTFSSKQIIEPKVVSLSRLILDMDNLLRRLIGEDVELITRPKPDLGLVKVDHGQLEQVLVNLAVNARDAMQDGGRLIIEADDITVDQEFAQSFPGLTPGEYVVMAVRDNGKGMTEEVRTRIFEPFFTTKERGKGTGLGLSICYGIVKQSGGYIFVDSEPGQGTTFKIYLPRVEGTVELSALSGSSHPLLRGTENVLLVEDEVSVREIVGYVLREQGYTVYEAINGRDALRIAQGDMGEELHLLITDVIMPGMGGVELVNQFKPLCPEVKVLFISGYTEDDMVHHGTFDHDTAVLLQKPFTPTELTNKVREVLDAQ